MLNRQEIWIIILHMSIANAYPCNVTFFEKLIEVESFNLCYYINYHAFMFVVFGGMSVLSLLVTIMKLICKSNTESSATLSFGFFVLSLGLETPYILCLLCLFLILLYKMIKSITPVWIDFHMSFSFRIHVEPSPMQSVEIAMDNVYNDMECPICMETNESIWFTTKCGHSYHLACITAWPQDTCPICRAIVIKS